MEVDNQMNDKIIFTVKEVAEILHSSPNYIYSLIEKGYLPAIKLGSIKILKSTLERFLIENEGNDLSDINNIKKINIISNNGDMK
jgi:excisionase family DNA binding protein